VTQHSPHETCTEHKSLKECIEGIGESITERLKLLIWVIGILVGLSLASMGFIWTTLWSNQKEITSKLDDAREKMISLTTRVDSHINSEREKKERIKE
jgi:hypothetical protein